MKGDRVMIVHQHGINSLGITDQSNVIVYLPKTDENGNIVFDSNGIASVEKAGGVRIRTTGHITGGPIRVRRSDVAMSFESSENLFSNYSHDYISLYPVFLDQYQRVGWFPSHNLQVIG